MSLFCLGVLAAGRGVSHARDDVSPRFRTAVGPPDTRRGGSNARPVEAALGRSEHILYELGESRKYLIQLDIKMYFICLYMMLCIVSKLILLS